MATSGGTVIGQTEIYGNRFDHFENSGVIANDIAEASIAAVDGLYGFLCGLSIAALGATVGQTVIVEVTGLKHDWQFPFTFPTGVGQPAETILFTFPRPLPAATASTDINVIVPAGGAGNVFTFVAAWGQYEDFNTP